MLRLIKKMFIWLAVLSGGLSYGMPGGGRPGDHMEYVIEGFTAVQLWYSLRNMRGYLPSYPPEEVLASAFLEEDQGEPMEIDVSVFDVDLREQFIQAIQLRDEPQIVFVWNNAGYLGRLDELVNALQKLFLQLVDGRNLDSMKILWEYVKLLGVQYEVVNYQDENGNTALHMAVFFQDIEMIRFLLDREAKMLNNHEEETPVHILQRLIEEKILPQGSPIKSILLEYLNALLMKAFEAQDWNNVKLCLKLFLQCGGDKNQYKNQYKNNNGVNLPLEAIKQLQFDIADDLIQACEFSDVEIASLCYNLIIDTVSRSKWKNDRDYPTWKDEKSVILEKIAVLIQQRPGCVNCKLQGNAYHTLLSRAVEYKLVKLVEVLLSHGANVDQMISFKEKELSILYHVIANRNFDIIIRLLAAEADPNAPQGATPARPTLLHQSIYAKSLWSFILLLGAGAKLADFNMNGLDVVTELNQFFKSSKRKATLKKSCLWNVKEFVAAVIDLFHQEDKRLAQTIARHAIVGLERLRDEGLITLEPYNSLSDEQKTLLEKAISDIRSVSTNNPFQPTKSARKVASPQ